MMAQTCDAVITVLPSIAELREVCLGWENLASGFGDSGIVINLGICEPVEIAAIARELAERGIALLDAPAFGTPAQAKEGKLALLVGGDERAFAGIRPILETLAQKVERVGDAGAPQALGAIADYLRGAELLAASEALRIGERFGLDPDYILRVREEGARAHLSTLLRQQVLSRRFGSGVSLGMIHRNIAIASRLAATMGAVAPLLEAARAAWEEAEVALGSGADHTAIIRWLEALRPRADVAESETVIPAEHSIAAPSAAVECESRDPSLGALGKMGPGSPS
jgi:3-hydroxyisobutyrate dehydrogenase